MILSRRIRPNQQYYDDQQRARILTQRMMEVVQRYYKRYESGIKANNVVATLSMVVIPFMQKVLQKYSEESFHRAMMNRYIDEEGTHCYGHDFVGDWRKNHSFAFNIILPIARSRRKDLDFNVDIATQLIIDIMTQAWFWKLSNIEKNAIHHNIYRIKRLLRT